ncbi:MAG: ABC transporter substrate-binding protein [Nitrospirota bacterium]|nr:ABC transporter substrate-binding protein [Nitrospirota bacterium]
MKGFNKLVCTLLCVGVFLVNIPAYAAEKTVGVIMTGGIPYYKEIHKAFMESLDAEGFGPGRAEIVVQTPVPEPLSWVNAARKLVAIGSDVIVSYGAPATLAVINETSDIPVVFAGVFDPLAVGIKGKNTTGISSKVAVATLVKNFKSIANFTTLGVVYNEAEKDTVMQANGVKQLEGNFGYVSSKINFRRKGDISRLENVDALFLTTGCAAMHCVNDIIGMARKAKIPTAATIGGGEDSGIILTIAADPSEQGKEAAERAAKILRGTNPVTLPVGQPKKIDMIINIREATEMGLKIPFDLLTAATKVIK